MWLRRLSALLLLLSVAACRVPEATLPAATLPAPGAVATALSAPRPTLTPVATTPLQQAVATPSRPAGTAIATGIATGAATGTIRAATPMATPSVVGTLRTATAVATASLGTPRALGTLVAPPAGSATGAQLFRANLTSELGYSLVLPSGWRTDPLPGAPTGQVSLYSYEPSTVTNPSAPLAANQTKIDIVPLSGMTGKSLSEVVAATATPSGRVLTTRNRELGGLPALQVDLETSRGASSAVFVLLGDQPLVIQGYGDLQPFDQIVASFRRV